MGQSKFDSIALWLLLMLLFAALLAVEVALR